MSKTKVPCALITTMDRHTTDALLDRLGLRHYFSCLVTGAPRTHVPAGLG
jgi:phosphoglycolate phosphatase-like HAD superfamily hydrolase